MKTRQFIFLIGCLLLGEWLPAQEYLDLWRNSKTENFYLIQQKFNEYFTNRDKGRGSGYKPFKRWEAFMAPRVYPSGKLINPAGLAMDEELRYQGRTGNTMRRNAHTGDWTSLGIKNHADPRGYGAGMGRVNCIVPHPADPQTLFVGTPAGGLWKTTDGGSNWIPLTDGIPVLGISGIAINPRHPDSIYILTGDGDGGTVPAGGIPTNHYSTGVLLSINGGDTWQSTSLQWGVSGPVYGFKLLMHPTNSNILLAVTNAGIYKTADGGVTWNLLLSEPCTDLAFKPRDPTTLYAAGADLIYVSSNSGTTWVTKNLGSIFGRAAIGVTEANPNYVYILSGRMSFNGLYRSVDGGQTFTRRSDSPNILGWAINPPYSMFSQAYYDLAVAVSPTNAEEVYAGGVNCWKSADGGTTWGYISYWEPDKVPAGKFVHADIHSLVFNGNTLYCGSDGGVSLTMDYGANWLDISDGLEITQFYSIGAPAGNLDIVYGGAQDNGVNKWIPGATMLAQMQGDGMECVVDYTDENIVYAFCQNGGSLLVTEDGGATAWTENSVPRSKLGWGEWVVPLIMDPTDHTRLYAGYNTVAQITNLGKTFTPISPKFNETLVALGMSAASPSFMYAAAPNSLKFSSTINSVSPTWSDITGTLPVNAAQITDVVVSQLDAGKAWVCFSGYSNVNKVYQTSDAGATWINISGTLPNTPVNCITYHNNGMDGIYIGTDIGVFYRDNTMTDWVPFRNGMPTVIVTDLEITNDKIRAATFGRGIWESDLYGSCADSYTLSGDVTGYQFFEASDLIMSTANINGSIGTNVQYKAANKITLSPGFKMAPQGGFLASIGDCNSSTSANRQSRDNRQYRGVYEGVMAGALGIVSVPGSIALPANRLKVYPNPFSRQSTIEFYLAKQSPVTISLWDLSGKKIKVLFESTSQPPGNYQTRLDRAGLRNGGYLVRLQTQDYQETKKIIITQ